MASTRAVLNPVNTIAAASMGVSARIVGQSSQALQSERTMSVRTAGSPMHVKRGFSSPSAGAVRQEAEALPVAPGSEATATAATSAVSPHRLPRMASELKAYVRVAYRPVHQRPQLYEGLVGTSKLLRAMDVLRLSEEQRGQYLKAYLPVNNRTLYIHIRDLGFIVPASPAARSDSGLSPVSPARMAMAVGASALPSPLSRQVSDTEPRPVKIALLDRPYHGIQCEIDESLLRPFFDPHYDLIRVRRLDNNVVLHVDINQLPPGTLPEASICCGCC
jgi:hypothetical protein